MTVPEELLSALVYAAIVVSTITPIVLVALLVDDWRKNRLW